MRALLLIALLAGCGRPVDPARRRANEESVAGHLRGYYQSQAMHRGARGRFAAGPAELDFLPAGFAEAWVSGAGKAAALDGYLFGAVAEAEDGKPLDLKLRSAAFAIPAQAGATGERAFLLLIDDLKASLWASPQGRQPTRWPDAETLSRYEPLALDEGGSASAPAASAPAPGAPAAAPAEAFPGADRLELIVAYLQGDGAHFGLEFSALDLKSSFEHQVKTFGRGFSPSDAKDMGLPPPQTQPFDALDEANPDALAKWVDGQQRYGKSLPNPGEGIAEAWARQRTSQTSSGGMIFIYAHPIAIKSWIRMHWQPGMRRWSYYTEDEERMGIESLILKRYSQRKPEEETRFRSELARVGKRLQEARSKGDPRGEADGILASIRGTILAYRRHELDREAARFFVESQAP